jgi:hypothetical protein
MNVARQISGKERTRGPLAVLVERSNGVPMEEALAKADEAGADIASNKRLSKALVGSEEWRSISEVLACWSGTMTAYDKPDKKLGKAIEYTDSETGTRYVFPVPEEHQGKKNVVLVAEHPHFTLETDGKTRVVQAKEVGVVSEFPVASENWHLGDAKYDIPTGKKVDARDEAARCLWRIDKRVGLVARGDYFSGYDGRRSVDLVNRASSVFGVAIEAGSGGDALHTASGQVALVRGITPEALRAMCEASEHEVYAFTTTPAGLEATRRLLDVLNKVEIKS